MSFNLHTVIGYILSIIGKFTSVGVFLPRGPTVRPGKVDIWAHLSTFLQRTAGPTGPGPIVRGPICVEPTETVHSTLAGKGGQKVQVHPKVVAV